jgi:hypothetical protein
VGGDLSVLTSTIHNHPDRPVTVVVDRAGTERTLTVVPADGRILHEKNCRHPAPPPTGSSA